MAWHLRHWALSHRTQHCHAQLCHTRLFYRQHCHAHTHTHLETHTPARARASVAHNSLTHKLSRTTLSHTHTARSHNLFFTMSHHVTMSFRCPAFPISCSHRFGRCWKKLTCWTIRFLNVLAMVPRKTVADVSKIQNYRRGEWF